MYGLFRRYGRICRLNEDCLCISSCKCIITDGHISDRTWLIPALGIIRNIDACHIHSVKCIIFNDDRLSCRYKDSSCRNFLKFTVCNIHRWCISDIFYHVLIYLNIGRNCLIQCQLDRCQASWAIAHISTHSVRSVNFGYCTDRIFNCDHISLCHELDLVPFKEVRETCCLIMVILYCDRSSVRADRCNRIKCSVNIDRVIMRTCKRTVANIDRAFASRHLYKICISGCRSSTFFRCFKVNIIHCDIFRMLTYHTESMKEMNIKGRHRNIFALPEKCSCMVTDSRSWLETHSILDFTGFTAIGNLYPVISKILDWGYIL